MPRSLLGEFASGNMCEILSVSTTVQPSGTSTSCGAITTTSDVVALVLPAESVALHVTVVVPVGKVVGEKVIVGCASTESSAVGNADECITAKEDVAMNVWEESAVKIGAVVSCTVTLK